MPVTYQDLSRMLTAAADALRANHELLSRLDSATGDGDHGTTMVRVAAAMVQSLQDAATTDLAPALDAVGWGVMGVDGGSTGPLLGSLFLGLAEGAAGKPDLSAPDLAAAFETGLAKLSTHTPAKVGDKTMMDALVPAVQALRKAADDGASPAQAMAHAAAAAQQGSDSTAQLQARFGRARNLGPRTIGQIDPGSKSIAILFAAFRDALN